MKPTLTFTFLAGACAAVFASSAARSRQNAPTSIPKLADAKTVSVTETYSTRGHGSPGLAPKSKFQIVLAKQNQLKIEVKSLGDDSATKPNLLVSDGLQVSEYVGQSNQVATHPFGEKMKPPFPPIAQLSPVLGLDYASEYELLEDGFGKFFGQAAKGVTYSSVEQAVDGRPATLITATVPPPKTERESKVNSRLWIAKDTGLPIRYERFSVANGQEVIAQRIDYSNWKVDAAIPASTFAWKAPKNATAYPTPGTLLPVGASVADFSVVTPDGKTVRLSDFKGKPVIIDFWATWCVPCQKSMPHLEDVYTSTKDQNVQVLALCVWDTKDAYQKWVSDKKSVYSFPTAFDPSGMAPFNVAASRFAVEGIPTQYLIDKDGKVAFAKMGGYETGDHDLEDALAKLGVNAK